MIKINMQCLSCESKIDHLRRNGLNKLPPPLAWSSSSSSPNKLEAAPDLENNCGRGAVLWLGAALSKVTAVAARARLMVKAEEDENGSLSSSSSPAPNVCTGTLPNGDPNKSSVCRVGTLAAGDGSDKNDRDASNAASSGSSRSPTSAVMDLAVTTGLARTGAGAGTGAAREAENEAVTERERVVGAASSASLESSSNREDAPNCFFFHLDAAVAAPDPAAAAVESGTDAELTVRFTGSVGAVSTAGTGAGTKSVDVNGRDATIAFGWEAGACASGTSGNVEGVADALGVTDVDAASGSTSTTSDDRVARSNDTDDMEIKDSVLLAEPDATAAVIGGPEPTAEDPVSEGDARGSITLTSKFGV
jgi:hypothetical protein